MKTENDVVEDGLKIHEAHVLDSAVAHRLLIKLRELEDEIRQLGEIIKNHEDEIVHLNRLLIKLDSA